MKVETLEMLAIINHFYGVKDTLDGLDGDHDPNSASEGNESDNNSEAGGMEVTSESDSN